jgi:hypothetical protein
LYPFALDPAPRLSGTQSSPGDVIAEKKRLKLLAEEGLMTTTKFQFPIAHMQKPHEFLPEVQRPITLTVDEIKADMQKYVKKFPKKIIPHMTEAHEINDIIHNYRRPKALAPKHTTVDFMEETRHANTSLVYGMPTLTELTIQKAQREIQEASTNKVIGLIAHLAYWNVFGHFNSLPIDTYHMKQIFISISDILTQLSLKYQGKKEYHTFLMPMILLAIRIEIDHIFKNSYPKFFSIPSHEQIAMKLINDLITKLIDPNLFYSRFSFFESGRDAITIKQQKHGESSTPQQKFYRRSALVEQLFPQPSEGKVRALFGIGKQALNSKTHELMTAQGSRSASIGSPVSSKVQTAQNRFR